MPSFDHEMEKRLWLGFAIITIAIIFYLAYWSFSSWMLNVKLSEFVKEAPSRGIVFTNGSPTIKGFPQISGLRFSGEVNVNGTPIIIPELRTTGMLLPGTTINIKMPNGFAVAPLGTNTIIGFEEADAKILLPNAFPKDASVQSLQEWRQKAGKITILNLGLKTKDAHITGQGSVGLDDRLQITALLSTETSGYKNLVQNFYDDGFIRRQDAALLSAALDGLATNNPITGTKTVNVDLTIQNQTFFVGPLPVARLPAIVWDTRNSPVRPLRSPTLSPVSR